MYTPPPPPPPPPPKLLKVWTDLALIKNLFSENNMVHHGIKTLHDFFLNKMCFSETLMPQSRHFLRNVTLIFDLDLADDLELGTNRCVYS